MSIIYINPYRFAAAGPTDPDFANVSLLLHGDGANGSTTIIDSSPSPKTVTAVGNAQISTAQSKFGGASIAFDGTGDSAETGISNDFAFGSGDFTIECWVWFNSITSTTTIMRLDSGSGFNGILFGHSTNLGCYVTSAGTSWDILSNQPLTGATALNTWHHVALTRSGNTFRGFVNGSQTFSVTSSLAIYQPNPMARIGAANPNGAIAMNGYIDDLRITKGVARYTSNFTPPTAQLPSPVDPYFSDVSLLLHGNGVNNSTTFTDSSSNNHTLTVNGGANISTAQSKFGGASMYFDGSGDSLSLPLDTSIAFGSGEFTFEFWLFRNASSSFVILDTRTPSQNPAGELVILVNSSGRLEILEQGFTRLAGGSTAVNTWNHYAIARDSSNVVTGYINGTSVDTWSTSLNFVLGSAPRIGSTVNGTFYLNGYIDDLRLTKGVARYTSSFTPPTEPFPND